MDCFIIYSRRIMKKVIYIVMRITRYTAVPEAAFESAKNAEEYLNEKETYDKNYHGTVVSIYVKDKM